MGGGCLRARPTRRRRRNRNIGNGRSAGAGLAQLGLDGLAKIGRGLRGQIRQRFAISGGGILAAFT